MDSSALKTVVRMLFDQVLNRGRLQLLDDCIADEFVEHNPVPGQMPGREGVKHRVRALREAFPDVLSFSTRSSPRTTSSRCGTAGRERTAGRSSGFRRRGVARRCAEWTSTASRTDASPSTGTTWTSSRCSRSSGTSVDAGGPGRAGASAAHGRDRRLPRRQGGARRPGVVRVVSLRAGHTHSDPDPRPRRRPLRLGARAGRRPPRLARLGAAALGRGVERFFATLERFDSRLASGDPLGFPAERLFQGPIADALTHVGQLALLRRLAGRR